MYTCTYAFNIFYTVDSLADIMWKVYILDLYLPQYMFWMNMPTNKNDMRIENKTAIIPTEIGTLNRSNKGYIQRPFSKNVPRKLKIELNVWIIFIFFFSVIILTYTRPYKSPNPKNITIEAMTEGNLCRVVNNSANINGKIIVCIPWFCQNGM